MINALFEDIDSGADFSVNRDHRYRLWRIWDKSQPLVMFIGLNPSTANESEPDNTIKSVIRICKSNGYGGFYMMNCWTYVTSKPELLQFDEVSEGWNDDILLKTASYCKDVVFAWGAFKIVKEKKRNQQLIKMFPNAKCLAMLKDGSPKHPLYCKSDSKFIAFNG